MSVSFLYLMTSGVKNIEQVASWSTTELKYIFFIIFFVFVISALIKRAWNALIMIILGFVVIGMFVIEPMILVTLAEWLAGLSKK